MFYLITLERIIGFVINNFELVDGFVNVMNASAQTLIRLQIVYFKGAVGTIAVGEISNAPVVLLMEIPSGHVPISEITAFFDAPLNEGAVLFTASL